MDLKKTKVHKNKYTREEISMQNIFCKLFLVLFLSISTMNVSFATATKPSPEIIANVKSKIKTIDVYGDSLVAERKGNQTLHDEVKRFTQMYLGKIQEYKSTTDTTSDTGLLPIKKLYVDKHGNYTGTFSNGDKMSVGHVADILDITGGNYRNFAVGGAFTDGRTQQEGYYTIKSVKLPQLDKEILVNMWNNKERVSDKSSFDFSKRSFVTKKNYTLDDEHILRLNGQDVKMNKHGHILIDNPKTKQTHIYVEKGLEIVLDRSKETYTIKSDKPLNKKMHHLLASLTAEQYQMKKNKDGTYSAQGLVLANNTKPQNNKLIALNVQTSPMVIKGKGGFGKSYYVKADNNGNYKYIDEGENVFSSPKSLELESDYVKKHTTIKAQANFMGTNEQIAHAKKLNLNRGKGSVAWVSAGGNDFLEYVAEPLEDIVDKYRDFLGNITDEDIEKVKVEIEAYKDAFSDHLKKHIFNNFDELAKMYGAVINDVLPNLKNTPLVNELPRQNLIDKMGEETTVIYNESVDKWNDFAEAKNKIYQSSAFARRFGHRTVFLNFYLDDILTMVRADPAKYGFTNVINQSYNGKGDPDTYLFYDKLHYTERAAKIIAYNKILFLNEEINNGTIARHENRLNKVKSHYYAYLDDTFNSLNRRAKRFSNYRPALSLTSNMFSNDNELGFDTSSPVPIEVGHGLSPVSFFVEDYSSSTNEAIVGANFSHDYSFEGKRMGFDTQLGEHLIVGLSQSTMKNDMGFDTKFDLMNSTGDLNSAFFGLSWNDFTLNGQVSSGDINVDQISRALGAFDNSLSGKSSGSINAHSFQLAYDYQDGGLNFSPRFSYQQKEIAFDAFDEAEMGVFDRHFSATKDTSLITSLGADFAYKFSNEEDTKYAIRANVTFSKEHEPEGFQLMSHTHNNPWNKHHFSSAEVEENRFDFGLGFDITHMGSIKASFDYETHLNKNGEAQDEHAIRAKIGFSF